MRKSFTVPEVARLYNFPAELNGIGQNIALIELGGGYSSSDAKTYFGLLKLPTLLINIVSVDQAPHKTSNINDLDAQVALDVEIAGAVAPRSQFTIYFSPNTENGLADALERAINDRVRPPSVILLNLGRPETSYSAEGLFKLNALLQDAADRTITVVSRTGDKGASDGVQTPMIGFPASSPLVLSMGGTTLRATTTTIRSEIVWNEQIGATGGGTSTLFPLPSWQQRLAFTSKATGRGVSDVAANADPATGYAIRVDGQTIVIGGADVAAALWAGLIALLNQGVGHPVGYVNPLLYRSIGPSGALSDITQGNNTVGKVDGFLAGPGYDLCTGWGTPNGVKLLEAFRNAKP